MIIQAILGLAQMGAAIGAAQDEKATRDLNSFNIKTEAVTSRAQALSQSTLRFNDFKEAMTIADTFFQGVANISSGSASTRAFKEAELEVTGDDISDIEVMSRLNDLKLKSEAAAEKRMGEQALRAGYLKAAMIGLQTTQDILDSRKGSAESIALAKQSGSSSTLLQSPRPRYRPT